VKMKSLYKSLIQPEFDDTNDQNTGYEYSVRFARLNYTATTAGSGGGLPFVNQVSEYADYDLFIDGVGFANNGTYTFSDPGTPIDAVLSDISLELYFRLNGTTGSVADWVVEFDDTNDQNTDYEYSVRFGRLTYTTVYTAGGGGGISVTVNDTVSEYADADIFVDGVGFANNGRYTFTDPATPADAILSNISLELYFRLIFRWSYILD